MRAVFWILDSEMKLRLTFYFYPEKGFAAIIPTVSCPCIPVVGVLVSFFSAVSFSLPQKAKSATTSLWISRDALSPNLVTSGFYSSGWKAQAVWNCISKQNKVPAAPKQVGEGSSCLRCCVQRARAGKRGSCHVFIQTTEFDLWLQKSVKALC